MQTASIGSAATQLKIPPAKGGKCRVWTASYGGQRAVIIKASGSGTVNYTVLDVTESNEKREVDAYIAAYAKGGEKVASSSPRKRRRSTKPSSSAPRVEARCGRGKSAPVIRYAIINDRRASSTAESLVKRK